MDYRHGTGHGVGSYLNVHEGPIGVGTKPGYAEVGFRGGEVISDEPGYYRDGEWGIRIENVVVCVEKDMGGEGSGGSGGKWLGFETVTMVPFWRGGIVVGGDTGLTEGERAWVDGYHVSVREKVGGWLRERGVPEGEGVWGWLRRETEPL